MPLVMACAVPHPPLIIPDVGRGYQEKVRATDAAYRQIAEAIARQRPEVVLVTSPHAPCYSDGLYVCAGAEAQGDMKQFGSTAAVSVGYDQELSECIASTAAAEGVPVVHGGPQDQVIDHGTLIPLWFLDNACRELGVSPAYKVVRIGISGLPPEMHDIMGCSIGRAIQNCGKRVAFVASGDCSHRLSEDGPYGFAPEGPMLDALLQEAFERNDLEALFGIDPALGDAAGECGVRSFQMMAAALRAVGGRWSSKLLSYEGPFGVGYLTAVITPEEEDSDKADPLVAYARACVESFVKTGQIPCVSGQYQGSITAEMTGTRAGAFVSLHMGESLRGCMGTIMATQDSLAEEIAYCARMACSQDPRFSPVKPQELDFLDYSVDVLGQAEDIPDESYLDPQRYGVIVTKGWRRGLLLPMLEGVDTVRMQVDIAKSKAGIQLDEQGVSLQRFQVVRHTRGGEARRGC